VPALRFKLLVTGVLSIGLVLQATGAQAIVYGEPDGNDHPNVGGVLADWDNENPGVELLCSGTLIDEDLFLTAAHCTAFLESQGIPNNEIWVSFDQDLDPVTQRTKLIQGTWVTHPDYGHDQSDPKDLAVIRLSRELRLAPARLPVLGLFDEMKADGQLKGQKFTAVGYGVHAPETGGGPPRFPFDGERWKAVSEFLSLQDAWLTLSQNDNTSDGGTCYGDSGGPNFLGAGQTETDIIASVTVTGDAMCVATNKTYRLDTAEAQNFIEPFLD
jgi:secreted trypsin-like serine protease